MQKDLKLLLALNSLNCSKMSLTRRRNFANIKA